MTEQATTIETQAYIAKHEACINWILTQANSGQDGLKISTRGQFISPFGRDCGDSPELQDEVHVSVSNVRATITVGDIKSPVLVTVLTVINDSQLLHICQHPNNPTQATIVLVSEDYLHNQSLYLGSFLTV